MSASPKLPPAGLDQAQPEASTSTTSGPAPGSLLSFLGGQARSNPLSLNPDPAKRRKKNPEPAQQSQTQGRIVLNAASGASWTVEKKSEEVNEASQAFNGNGSATGGRGRGKGKAKGGGEEDEMKEMGKRAKAAQRGRGGKRNGVGKRKPDKGGQLDLKANQDGEGESPLHQLMYSLMV